MAALKPSEDLPKRRGGKREREGRGAWKRRGGEKGEEEEEEKGGRGRGGRTTVLQVGQLLSKILPSIS